MTVGVQTVVARAENIITRRHLTLVGSPPRDRVLIKSGNGATWPIVTFDPQLLGEGAPFAECKKNAYSGTAFPMLVPNCSLISPRY
jgi:hypothetical protein